MIVMRDALEVDIRGLLEQNLFRDASLRMECVVLEGKLLDEEWLRSLPESCLLASPLLMQAWGEACFRYGQLYDAKRWLGLAVKGLGVMAFPSRLLTALCLYAQVLQRLGNTTDAEALLIFLQQEYDRASAEEKVAELSHTLASGSHLNGDRQRTKLLYIEAIRLYEQKHLLRQATYALAELLLHCGEELTVEEWEDMAWRLRRWRSDPQGRHILAIMEWVGALRDAQQREWRSVYERLQSRIVSDGMRDMYGHYVYSQLLFFQAAIVVSPEQAVGFLDEIRKLRLCCPADLQMQHALLLVLYEAAKHLGLFEQSEADFIEASIIGSQLTFSASADAPIRHLTTVRMWQLDLSQNEQVDAQLPERASSQAIPQMQNEWRVCFFGGLSFKKGTDEVSHIRWKRKKAQEMLIYLLLQPRYRCSKDRLMELLLLGEDPEKASTTMYVLIHQLKQTLHDELSIPDGVFTREGLVMLREDAIAYVDVERYQVLLRVADQLWLEDRALSAELYQEAFMLYDEILPEVPHYTWLENMKEYIVDKQVTVIRKLCQTAREQHDMVSEETYYQEWIRLRPYQEEAYQHLMSLLQRSKRHIDLKLVYERYAERCRNELGVEPSDEIRDILRRSEH